MTEREKIINIMQSVRYCKPDSGCGGCKYDAELDNYSYVSCRTLRIADALIEAGYGDVAEWKAKANDWKQRFESRDKQYNDGIVSSCKALQLKDEKIAKYKRRAEVAEKELAEVKNEQV